MVTKQDWKFELSEGVTYRNGCATPQRKDQYIENLARILVELRKEKQPYYTVGQALRKECPDLAARAFQMHLKDPNATEKTISKAKTYLRQSGLIELKITLEEEVSR